MRIQGFKTKATLIAALAVAGASPSVSQTVPDASVPQTGLNIPDELTIFGKNDPNVRRATAIVNGDIITGTDVSHRLALIVAANGGEVSDEEKQRLRLQVLRNLIDETLQIQEAEANEISISAEEVESTFRQVAQQNFKQDIDAFDQYLRTQGSSTDTLKRQIKGELAWNRLLRRNIQPFINVGDEEVNAIVDHLKSQGSPAYLESVTEEDADAPAFPGMPAPEGKSSGDDLYDQAVALVCREGKASTSFVQRHLQIGYNRAARIIEQMEKEGVVSKSNHVGKREVLARNFEADFDEAM